MQSSSLSQNALRQDNIKSLLDSLIEEQKSIDKKNNSDSLAANKADQTVGISYMLYGLLELKKLIEEG